MKLRSHSLAFLAAAALAFGAHAQTKGPGDYANKPVRLVVPFVPGGPTDIQGRMPAEKLSQRVGQQVIVDNRGGANGNIGMEIVARAPADGYTLVIATVGTWAVNPHLYSLPFDVLKDFSPITQVSSSPGILVVHPTVNAKTVKDLIALAKEKQGGLNYGSSGVGGFGHISGELFCLMTSTKMTHPVQELGAAAYRSHQRQYQPDVSQKHRKSAQRSSRAVPSSSTPTFAAKSRSSESS